MGNTKYLTVNLPWMVRLIVHTGVESRYRQLSEKDKIKVKIWPIIYLSWGLCTPPLTPERWLTEAMQRLPAGFTKQPLPWIRKTQMGLPAAAELRRQGIFRITIRRPAHSVKDQGRKQYFPEGKTLGTITAGSPGPPIFATVQIPFLSMDLDQFRVYMAKRVSG